MNAKLKVLAEVGRKKLLQAVAGVGLVAVAGVLVMDSLHWNGLWSGEPVARVHAAAPSKAAAEGRAEAPPASAPAVTARTPNTPRRAAPVTPASTPAEAGSESAAAGQTGDTAAAAESPGHGPDPALDRMAATGPRCPIGFELDAPQGYFPPVAMMLAACASTDQLLRNLGQQVSRM